MTMPETTVTVAGRLGTWHPRVTALGQETVWVTWLSHPDHGTLGLYCRDATAPHGRRVRRVVTGTLAPLRVQAQDDDPRCPATMTQTPLLIQVQTLQPWTAPTSDAPRRWLVVGAPVWQGHCYVAPTHVSPDLYGVAAPGQHTGASWAWTRLYGVIEQVAAWRYLRYLALPPSEVGDG